MYTYILSFLVALVGFLWCSFSWFNGNLAEPEAIAMLALGALSASWPRPWLKLSKTKPIQDLARELVLPKWLQEQVDLHHVSFELQRSVCDSQFHKSSYAEGFHRLLRDWTLIQQMFAGKPPEAGWYMVILPAMFSMRYDVCYSFWNGEDWCGKVHPCYGDHLKSLVKRKFDMPPKGRWVQANQAIAIMYPCGRFDLDNAHDEDTIPDWMLDHET